MLLSLDLLSSLVSLPVGDMVDVKREEWDVKREERDLGVGEEERTEEVGIMWVRMVRSCYVRLDCWERKER